MDANTGGTKLRAVIWGAVGTAVLGAVVAMMFDWTGATDWRPGKPSDRSEDNLSIGERTPGGWSVTTSTPEATELIDRAEVEATVEPVEDYSPPASEPEVTKENARESTTLYYLSELTPVDTEIVGRPGRCTGGCTGFDGDAAKIGTQTYPNSFLTRLDANGRRSISIWNSLGACSKLTSTVGATRESPTTTIEFRISLDDGPDKTLASVRTGKSEVIQVPIKNVDRFTLSAFISGEEKDDVEAVWGNAALDCEPGALDE